VRPLLVVVSDVGSQQPHQLAPAEHQRPVQTLRADGLDPPRSSGVRFWSPDWGWRTSAPSLQKTVEALVNLASWSRSSNLIDEPCSARSLPELLACWVAHAASGLAVTPATMPRLLLSWTNDSIDSVLSRIVSTVQEVAGDDRLGLGWQEPRPGGPGASWRRAEAVSSQRGPGRGGAHPDAELAERSGDPDAAHRGLCRASRRLRSAISGSIGGRPGVRPLRWLHVRRTRSR